jgi:methane monooxygenase component C
VSLPAPREHRVRLTFEGAAPIEIGCFDREDIISAALRQNLLLLSDCRAGTCGTCRAFVEQGEPEELLEHSPHALGEREREQGWVLGCRLQPRGDVHLDFDYPAERVARFEPDVRRAQVVALEQHGTGLLRLVLRTLAAQDPLDWQPGQYVRLALGGAERAYSMANLSGPERELEFFIQRLPGGRFSSALAALPGPGALLSLRGPFGAFTLRDAPGAQLFVAGGTGLAPVLALLRALARRSQRPPALLIFGARSEQGLFASRELGELEASYPELQVRVAVEAPSATWSGARGDVIQALESWQAPQLANLGAAYLCGPAGMLERASASLARRGLAARSIHRETFDNSEREQP